MLELTPELLQIGLGLIIAISAGAVIFVLVNPYLSGEAQAAKRIQGVSESKVKRSPGRAKDEEINNRRKQVSDSLREIEDRQKAKEKISLRLRLAAGRLGYHVQGLLDGKRHLRRRHWRLRVFDDAERDAAGRRRCRLCRAPLASARWVLARMTKRRQNKFTNEFANAIDVIVRGVKSGLPLNECLGIIARESPSPVREEFSDLVEQTRVGIPLAECFDRMMQRVPLPEVKFFAIVIGIQSQAGGNLSEALGNLSGVLRDRKRLAMKVKAMSAEALGVGRCSRIAAVHRHDDGVPHDAVLHQHPLHHEGRSIPAVLRRRVDDMRAAGDAQDDQLQVLSRAIERVGRKLKKRQIGARCG